MRRICTALALVALILVFACCSPAPAERQAAQATPSATPAPCPAPENSEFYGRGTAENRVNFLGAPMIRVPLNEGKHGNKVEHITAMIVDDPAIKEGDALDLYLLNSGQKTERLVGVKSCR